VRRSHPDARRLSSASGCPAWSVVAAGASAGIAVVVFLVIPWPLDLVVLPSLAGWALLLSGLSGPDGWQRPGRILLLVGISALVLGSLAMGGLALLGP
jgi:hypothetical protein